MRLIFVILFLFCFTSFFTYSQDYSKIDSLKKSLLINSNDTNKIKAYNHLSYIYINSTDTAMMYVDSALELANRLKKRNLISKTHYQKGKIYQRVNNYNKALSNYFISLKIAEELSLYDNQSDCAFEIGNIYKDQGNFKKALQFYNKTIKIEEINKNQRSLARAINNTGLVYWMQDSYEKALIAFHQSLEIKEKINDLDGVAGAYTNIGVIYYVTQNREKAIEYWEKSLAMWEKTGDKKGKTEILNNLGAVYTELEKFDLAITYLNKSLKLKEELGDKRSIATTCSNIGEVYIQNKDFNKAEEFFNRTESIYKQLNDKEGLCASYQNFANLYNETKNFKLALEYIKKAIELSEQIESLSRQKNCYFIASTIYEGSGNFEKSLEYFKLYYTLNDSIYKRNNTQNIVEIQTKFETEKKEKEIELLNKDKLINEQHLAESQLIRNVVIFIIGLVLIIAVILYNRYRIKKKLSDDLTYRNMIIEQQKEELITQKENLNNTYDELRKKNNMITDSINYAKKIQDAMMPSDEYIKSYISDYFIFLRPKSIVSGDFYWFFANTEKAFIALGDCTGHGVPGAFMSMIGNTLLNEIIIEDSIHKPDEILEKINERIFHLLVKKTDTIQANNDGIELSLVIIEKEKCKITMSSANQHIYYVIDKELNIFEGDHFSLGGGLIRDLSFKYKSREVLYKPNQTQFYLMSDGFQDQFGGEENKKYMNNRIKKLIKDNYSKSMDSQAIIFESEFETWKGRSKQIDDVLVLGFKI